ncbi:hypothetical protein C4572_03050 [Candidatus Parcubacteria bacterium]|nr:MAG: hypothetical protein C4572_03050 [Candidatus Parcubacteria bacterium]
MDEKKSSKGLIIGVIIALIIGVVAWQFLSKGGNPEEDTNGQVNNGGALAGRDAIFVADQKPGRFVNVGLAILSKKGFIAIHQEEADKIGVAIGNSSLLESKEHKNISVTLNRRSVSGENMYATLHHDNGDGIFNPAEDAHAKDKDGNMIMMKFTISDSASEPIEYKM